MLQETPVYEQSDYNHAWHKGFIVLLTLLTSATVATTAHTKAWSLLDKKTVKPLTGWRRQQGSSLRTTSGHELTQPQWRSAAGLRPEGPRCWESPWYIPMPTTEHWGWKPTMLQWQCDHEELRGVLVNRIAVNQPDDLAADKKTHRVKAKDITEWITSTYNLN